MMKEMERNIKSSVAPCTVLQQDFSCFFMTQIHKELLLIYYVIGETWKTVEPSVSTAGLTLGLNGAGCGHATGCTISH